MQNHVLSFYQDTKIWFRTNTGCKIFRVFMVYVSDHFCHSISVLNIQLHETTTIIITTTAITVATTTTATTTTAWNLRRKKFCPILSCTLASISPSYYGYFDIRNYLLMLRFFKSCILSLRWTALKAVIKS